jgi:hypothetical protein
MNVEIYRTETIGLGIEFSFAHHEGHKRGVFVTITMPLFYIEIELGYRPIES